jgi:hypothetical protein
MQGADIDNNKCSFKHLTSKAGSTRALSPGIVAVPEALFPHFTCFIFDFSFRDLVFKPIFLF